MTFSLLTTVIPLCVLVFCVHGKHCTFLRIFLYKRIKCDHDRTLNLDVSGTRVYFYDFQNKFKISARIGSAADAVAGAHALDYTKKLIIYVPGYKSPMTKDTVELIRGAFHSVPNVYLVIIDHSMYTWFEGIKLRNYEHSVRYVFYVGRAVGRLLAAFRARGYPSGRMHAIGHSLGSQMLAVSGQTYRQLTGERLARATGLDPAGPCFAAGRGEQLRSGLARYVEVYHCDSGCLGSSDVLADTDFFFNRGSKQPGCTRVGRSAACSHRACLQYYAMSVRFSGWYTATKCASYRQYARGRCAGNEVTIAGYRNPGNASSVFYVRTGGKMDVYLSKQCYAPPVK